jgi:hypothetical protein
MKQINIPGTNGKCGRVAVSYELSLYIPGIKLESLNTSFGVASMGAMFGRRAKAKKQRHGVAMVLRSEWGQPPDPPLTVTITRIAPRKLDCDNLVGSAKACRDGVADWLGVDDRTSRSGVVWAYDQGKKGKKEYGVIIHIDMGKEDD